MTNNDVISCAYCDLDEIGAPKDAVHHKEESKQPDLRTVENVL